MSGKDELIAYLNDHLSGSVAALQLIEHQRGLDLPAEAKEFYTALQRSLEEIIRRAGGEPSQLRKVGGWIAEKLARVKLVIDKASSGAIEDFEVLEVLLLGIHGKAALWRALQVAGPAGLRGAELDVLERRAREQVDRVEARRLIVARLALTPAA
jgi:hypothetical protein